TVDMAVTVVEWGTGKVEHLADSRLEVVLERAVGTGSLGPEALADPGAAEALGTGAGGANDEEDDEDEDDAEPRRITFTGIGPRWADGPPELK
ncbi:MAG: tsaE, partial [Citricoccus sp.]|nr:tsaE [Citricoccus sp. WCRC_4]